MTSAAPGWQDQATVTYLYRCWDLGGQLLYVGVSEGVKARLAQHAKDKFWWSDVSRVTTMGFDSRIKALWAEWAVITTCSPVYNASAIVPTDTIAGARRRGAENGRDVSDDTLGDDLAGSPTEEDASVMPVPSGGDWRGAATIIVRNAGVTGTTADGVVAELADAGVLVAHVSVRNWLSNQVTVGAFHCTQSGRFSTGRRRRSTQDWIVSSLRSAPTTTRALLARPDCPVRQAALYTAVTALIDDGLVRRDGELLEVTR